MLNSFICRTHSVAVVPAKSRRLPSPVSSTTCTDSFQSSSMLTSPPMQVRRIRGSFGDLLQIGRRKEKGKRVNCSVRGYFGMSEFVILSFQ